MTYFEKVIVANRGEIAVRVLRTLKRLGISSVAVYSDEDAGAPHVRLADEAVRIGPGPPSLSYLDASTILDVARRRCCDALHPGYGFLAENADFASSCTEAGVTFVGPAPDVIESMGNKIHARALVRSLGVPVVPGAVDAIHSLDEARDVADGVGYPVVIKASAGGGGIGMRVVRDPADLEAALDSARSEGERFFGDAQVYVERYFDDPRHVEVQIVGDAHGGLVHLGERDCTIQRRHQKLVEETPAPTVDDAMRETIVSHALTVARHVGYSCAGTIEGLVADREFYFLEMNTRLQVEHPVTELVTGIDLVDEQLRVASGRRLSVDQAGVVPNGVSLECRVNAERAHLQFAPSPGRITRYAEPEGGDVRVDSGVEVDSTVSPYYDSLLAKVIVRAPTREAATVRMLSALADFEIEGVDTLLPFHRRLLATEEWGSAGSVRHLISDREWLKACAAPAA